MYAYFMWEKKIYKYIFCFLYYVKLLRIINV
jgi:hypothetical protein